MRVQNTPIISDTVNRTTTIEDRALYRKVFVYEEPSVCKIFGVGRRPQVSRTDSGLNGVGAP